MSLRHALLALLNINPQTGYDLVQRFNGSLEYVWRASQSQIYPELRRMEKEGLVEAMEVDRGTRAVKREYGLTEAGVRALEEWADTVVPPQFERSAAHLHAMYLEYTSFEVARQQFRAHLNHYRQLKAGWDLHVKDVGSHTTELMKVRLGKEPEHAHAAITAYKVHMYEGLIARAETEIAWAERGLELVAQLEREAGLAPGERVTEPTATR